MESELAKPVEVMLANNDRVTVRVGDVFLKVDADQARTDREVAAMEAAPVPTAPVLWRKPPVLALATLAGTPIGKLDEPSRASAAAWRSVGEAVRAMHDAPLPDRMGKTRESRRARLDSACDWLRNNHTVPAEVVEYNRQQAELALEPRPHAFTHGDLHIAHVFVDGDALSGILDWSEAGQDDPMFDVASLVLGHADRLDDFLAGYGDADRDVIHAWRSFRCLVVLPWLFDNGYGNAADLPEAQILRQLADGAR